MSAPLTDDLFEQIEQLERTNRRWRWLALTGLAGTLVLSLLSCASLGTWFMTRQAYRYPEEYYEMRMHQSDAEHVQFQVQLQRAREELEEAKKEATNAKRELEELRKKVGQDKAPPP